MAFRTFPEFFSRLSHLNHKIFIHFLLVSIINNKIQLNFIYFGCTSIHRCVLALYTQYFQKFCEKNPMNITQAYILLFIVIEWKCRARYFASMNTPKALTPSPAPSPPTHTHKGISSWLATSSSHMTMSNIRWPGVLAAGVILGHVSSEFRKRWFSLTSEKSACCKQQATSSLFCG